MILSKRVYFGTDSEGRTSFIKICHDGVYGCKSDELKMNGHCNMDPHHKCENLKWDIQYI